MEIIDLIREGMRNQGQKAGISLSDIKNLIPSLWDNPKELQKARQGKRFLSRWYSYEKRHLITDEDFLLVLRDTVLMLGKFSGTAAMNNLINKKGDEFGLYLELTGEIAARIPENRFIRQCYGLENAESLSRRTTAGDKLLKDETGFSSYKSFEQKTAVHTAMKMPEGSTLLVTLSTGEGKSLVTQMAVAREPGLTVLIVPTTALGKDQARAASAVLKKVPKESIWDLCGDQTAKLPELKEKLNKKEIRLLITSPEALVKNTGLRKALLKAASEQYLGYLVIDEAHIVQDWGAAFRPDFQFLSIVRRELLKESNGKLRTILLSATLTENAVEQLKELFSENNGIKTNWIPVRCDSLRTEIRFLTDTLKNSPNLQEEHAARILHYVKTLPKPMLIYTIRPEGAENWRKLLWENGIRNTASFTGLTEDKDRSDIIRKWNTDELDIITATSAFGMGIDKPDVRTVIHAVMPESINRFYQEVGRGGRDGLPSLSMLCCCPQAEYHQMSTITHRKIMTWEKMTRRWFEMIKDGNVEADVVELNTRSVPDYFNEKEKKNSGNRNRDWNLHTILFMIRHQWIEFKDMKYSAETGDYLIKVRMKDPLLLQDEKAVAVLGEAARESEYDASDREMKVFQEMIRNENKQCFAESFTRIYTQTDLNCGGCPQHAHESFHSEAFHLHNYIPRYILSDNMEFPFRIWRGNPCLLISQTDPTDQEKSCEIAEKLLKARVSTWIQNHQPSLRSKAERFPGLVLDLDEAEELLSHHPSILGKGIMITMGNDPGENQRLLEFGCKIMEKGAVVAFHMKPGMIHRGYGKPLHEIVKCRVMTEQEL